MYRISVIAIVFIAILAYNNTNAGEFSKATVRKLAQELADATYAGDYAKVIDSTYAIVVSKLGGPKQAIQIYENGMEKMKEKGHAIERFEIGEPGEFAVKGDKTFVVVPVVLDVSFPMGIIRTNAYLLAISSDLGESWKFIDGTALESKAFRDCIIPEMPAGFMLPEISRSVKEEKK